MFIYISMTLLTPRSQSYSCQECEQNQSPPSPSILSGVHHANQSDVRRHQSVPGAHHSHDGGSVLQSNVNDDSRSNLGRHQSVPGAHDDGRSGYRSGDQTIPGLHHGNGDKALPDTQGLVDVQQTFPEVHPGSVVDVAAPGTHPQIGSQETYPEVRHCSVGDAQAFRTHPRIDGHIPAGEELASGHGAPQHLRGVCQSSGADSASAHDRAAVYRGSTALPSYCPGDLLPSSGQLETMLEKEISLVRRQLMTYSFQLEHQVSEEKKY